MNDTERFYRAALLGLCAWEGRQPTKRRFCAEADAAWSMIQGHLREADRIDLLIRDAAVKHPAAFAPRTAFALLDLPEDEPFGPHWESPYGRDTGRQAWKRALEDLSLPPRELWHRSCETWGVTADPLELRSTLDASSRVLVIGASAVAALADVFLERSDELDWGRQVAAVSATPAGVQLAGLVPLCAGNADSARAHRLTPEDSTAAAKLLQALGMPRPDVFVGARQLADDERRFVDAVRGIA